MFFSPLAGLRLSKVSVNSTLTYNELLTKDIAAVSLYLLRADCLGQRRKLKK